MLVDITINQKEYDKTVAHMKAQPYFIENPDIKMTVDEKWYHQELGIYFATHILKFLYNEKIVRLHNNYGHVDSLREFMILNEAGKIKEYYGIADNIEQIKEYFAEEIADKNKKYFIVIDHVFQEHQPESQGFRWYKHGEYIGELDLKCEYLYDEDFGKDWEGYVMTFDLWEVL